MVPVEAVLATGGAESLPTTVGDSNVEPPSSAGRVAPLAPGVE